MTAVAVALAGGLGALARVEVGNALRRHGRGAWGTRLVNLLGTALLASLPAFGPSNETRQIVAIGALGGFTTFSTWMVEATDQTGRRQAVEVVLPLAAGLLVGVLVTWVAT